MTNETRERLQAERDRLADEYYQHVVVWSSPESIKESGRRYNEFQIAAARLNRN